MRWHLDGWDAFGGRAFATQRPRGEDLVNRGDRWGPTVYIGSPSFRPELIVNPAIALAACRSGNFDPQVPLFEDKENELAFPSPEAVADFVRRAFIGGGRNRGGEGVPVVDGGPESPPEGEKGKDAIDKYLNEFASMRSVVEKQGSDALSLLATAHNAFETSVHPGSVVRGAVQLVSTLLAGYPRQKDYAAAEIWYPAASSLYRALSELGIWQAWAHEEDAQLPLTVMINYLWRSVRILLRIHGGMDRDDLEERNVVAVVLHVLSTEPSGGRGGGRDREEYLRHLYYGGPFHFDYTAPTLVEVEIADRFEAMFRWPLPTYVRADGVGSVGQLLSSFIAAPTKFDKAGNGTLDIVTFAAALLASRTEARSRLGWRERAAAHWLARSLPTWVFSDKAEELIWKPENNDILDARN